MKRRILIITNAGKIGSDNYCEGVFKDKANYISFFKTAYGGYYSDLEIKPFDKPTKVEIKEELSLMEKESIDFSIIIFCGHGWHSAVSNSNIFHLNDTEEIDSLEFRKGAKKRIIIEDNCRKKYRTYINESFSKAFSVEALYDDKRQQPNPEQCKLYYNKRISNCPEQIICARACNVDELAGDSSVFGGYYSSSLLKQTVETVEVKLKTIDLSQNYCIFNFPSSHNNAIPLVKKLSNDKQNPQIEKPRVTDSDDYLPFAIIA